MFGIFNIVYILPLESLCGHDNPTSRWRQEDEKEVRAGIFESQYTGERSAEPKSNTFALKKRVLYIDMIFQSI